MLSQNFFISLTGVIQVNEQCDAGNTLKSCHNFTIYNFSSLKGMIENREQFKRCVKHSHLHTTHAVQYMHKHWHTCAITHWEWWALSNRNNHNLYFREVGEQSRLTPQQLSEQKTIWIAQTTGLCKCVYLCGRDVAQ